MILAIKIVLVEWKLAASKMKHKKNGLKKK